MDTRRFAPAFVPAFVPAVAVGLVATLLGALVPAAPAHAAAPSPWQALPLPDAVAPLGNGDDVSFSAQRQPVRREPVRTPTRQPSPSPKPAPAPDPRTPASRGAAPSPWTAGLAAAGGAAIGTTVGLGIVGVMAGYATQTFGPQPPEVVIATAIIGISLAVATPFLTGLGAGIAVLLVDGRSKPDEWMGLLTCAASGYCAGLAAVAGTFLGGIACFPPSRGCTQPPSPDRPAEWTAIGAMGGLVGGGLIGVIAGYALAPDQRDPYTAIGIGAVGGAFLGSALVGGITGGVATALRP
jgi:hypothetical protein